MFWKHNFLSVEIVFPKHVLKENAISPNNFKQYQFRKLILQRYYFANFTNNSFTKPRGVQQHQE